MKVPSDKKSQEMLQKMQKMQQNDQKRPRIRKINVNQPKWSQKDKQTLVECRIDVTSPLPPCRRPMVSATLRSA